MFDEILNMNEDLDMIFSEETGIIGKWLGKKQFDKRDPGEVIAYLRHHSIPGNILDNGGLYSTINSVSKSGNGAKKLYGRYLSWCQKEGVKPSSEETFLKIAKLYYQDRAKSKGIKYGATLAGGILTTAGSQKVKNVSAGTNSKGGFNYNVEYTK